MRSLLAKPVSWLVVVGLGIVCGLGRVLRALSKPEPSIQGSRWLDEQIEKHQRTMREHGPHQPRRFGP